MKNKLVLLIILVSCLYAQSRIYPPLSGDEITDIHFINESEVIFVNSGGCIFKSYDGGITWDQKELFQGEVLRKIRFIDEKNGFVLPEQTTHQTVSIIGLIVTTDGGENWRVEKLSLTRAEDIIPISNKVILQSDWDGNILRLDNYFNQWDTTYQMPEFVINNPELGDPSFSYGYFTEFELLPSGNILALGLYQYASDAEIIGDSVNILLKSSDEGLTWDTLWSGFHSFAHKIEFISDSIGYLLSGNDTLFYTETGGTKWIKKSAPPNINYTNDISVITEDSVFAIGNDKAFFSSNKGESWSQLELDLERNEKVKFYNENIGFIYGANLFRTTNSGQTWENINEHFIDNIYDLDFITPEIGFANGHHGFYKTIEGGKNWEPITTLPPDKDQLDSSPDYFEMLTENLGFVSRNYDCELFKTTNGGNSWTKLSLPNSPTHLRTVSFFNQNFGFVAAEKMISSNPNQYEFFHCITTNQGESWTVIPVGDNSETRYFYDIKFIKPNHFYATNRSGLWLSLDTAKTWNSIHRTGGEFDFFNADFGVLASSYTTLKTTTDGGKIWKSFDKVTGVIDYDLEILGNNKWGEYIALECGGDGKVIKYKISPDGDISFQNLIETGTNLDLYNIEKIFNGDNLNTWISGSGFNIQLIDHLHEITDIEEETIGIPKSFSLIQNYPNPFNPSTTISYSVPYQSHIVLKIYDVIGQEIKTIVNTVKSQGNYEVEFNGNNLSSGVYIYQLTSGNFRSNKKMLLIK